MTLTVEQEQLVVDNIRLTHHIAKRYTHSYMDHEDIAGWGTEGLIQASKRFDKNLGFRFSTIACRCIENIIIKKVTRTKSRHDVSLDYLFSESGRELYEFMPSDELVEQQAMENVDLYNALQELDNRELFVIANRYGLFGYTPIIQSEVAKILKVSQVQASRIERKALRKMRNYLLEGCE